MALYLGTDEICPTKISNNTYGWLGPDTEYVGKLYEWNGTMNDTTYSSWTPSTSSSTVLASASNVATLTFDRSEYIYYFIAKWNNNFVFSNGTTLQKVPVQWTGVQISYYYKYPNNYNQYLGGEDTFSAYTSTPLASQYYLRYYNSSGTLTGTGSQYGPCYSTNYISFGTSTSNDDVTLTFSRPAGSARCSTSYFDTTVAPNLDLTNSTLNYRLDIFRRPATILAPNTQVYNLLSNAINNNYSF